MSNQTKPTNESYMSQSPKDIDDPVQLFTRWCWNEQTKACMDGRFTRAVIDSKKQETIRMLRALADEIEADQQVVTLVLVSARFDKGDDSEEAKPEDASRLAVDVIFQGQAPGLVAAANMVGMNATPFCDEVVGQYEKFTAQSLMQRVKEIFGDDVEVIHAKIRDATPDTDETHGPIH